MDTSVTDLPNGVSWIRDCLLDSPEIVKAGHRLRENSREGIRHFSAIGRTVPLERAKTVESEISRLEREEDRELDPGLPNQGA
jgi:hypothetical protein